MRNFKKVIAAGLALLMLALSVNVSFAAEEYSDAEAVAVAKVNAAGIMTGTDKGFEPTKTLTRAEAAAIMVRMKGISKATVDQSAGTTLFSDVPASHWAAGYINVASNYEIIKGVGAGKFAPEKEVTVAEYYTMAIRALGAGKLVDSEGTWPTNYVNFAIENDLAEDVTQIYTATATRLTAAVIAANTLEAKMWEKSLVKSNGEITWAASNSKTIVESVLKYTIREGNSPLSLTVKGIKAKDNLVTDNSTQAGVDHEVAKGVDLSTLKVGMTYEYWLNKDDEIAGFWIPVEKDSVEFTEIKEYKAKEGKDEITVVTDGKEKTYTIDDVTAGKAPVIVINEEALDAFDASKLKKNKNLDGVLYVEDGIVTSVYLTQFEAYGIVDEVTAKKITFANTNIKTVKNLEAGSFRIDDEDVEYVLTKDGKSMNFADLEEGDAIRYYTVDDDKVVAEVIEPAASGKVANINANEHFIKIDGTKYDWAHVQAGDEQTDAEKKDSLFGLELDKEIEIYTNQAGKIVMFETIKEAAGDVAVVKYMRQITDKYGEKNAEVKLFFMDGTTSDTLTIDLKKSAEKYGVAKKETEKSDDNTVLKLSDDTIGIGSLVVYSINDGKVTFKPVNATDKEFEALTNANDNLVINDSTASYIMNNGKKAYVDDNTKFIEIKAKDENEVKVALVDFDDLDAQTKDLKNYGAVVNFDADDKTVDAVVYTFDAELNNIKRAKENNFAVVVAASGTKVDDDKDAVEYDIIYTDGTKATVFGTEDDFGTGYDALNVGYAYDIAISGDRLTSAELGSDKEVWNMNLAGYAEDNDTKHRELTIAGKSAKNVSANVLVLLKDGSKYTVGDISDIEDYSEEPDEGEKIDSIIRVFGANDEDDHEEIVVIIYEADVAYTD